ncbi:type VI secretion system amidase effector protein Tae4 [Thalassomonas sp. RHCl1]|uniref:type VI secretion system amidase effector protein Tae4 n=1 Tax=Thalassomonas sp. RHCl1 TaxID=2995320 RepID=UPI00248B4354|nr:type VI secretion system amidase effector protein Tae4 [Thalassomonas sp. RHCl1]
MLTFKKLWDNHPTISGNEYPCSTNGVIHFSDQCAIRLGVALAKCGVNTAYIAGARHCWHHKKIQGHILAAQELALGLSNQPLGGMEQRQNVDPKNFKNIIKDKRGIIFFKNFWVRSDGNRTGDHIDLWNGTRLTDWKSWLRIQLGLSWDGTFSDFGRSAEVWFWEV